MSKYFGAENMGVVSVLTLIRNIKAKITYQYRIFLKY